MQTQTKTLERISWQIVSLFLGLLLVVGIVPQYVHNQFITGPIVNATLFIAAATLGTGNAILIGLLPSTVALASGLLPAVLSPMVPFIMISNAILILVFSAFRKINFGIGAIAAALAKYLFLYISVSWVTQLIAQKSIAAKAAAVMMQWPQAVTALLGAFIAFGVLKALKKI